MNFGVTHAPTSRRKVGCGGTPLGARVMGDKTGAAASEAMMTVEERVQGADDAEVTMKSEGAGNVPDVH